MMIIWDPSEIGKNDLCNKGRCYRQQRWTVGMLVDHPLTSLSPKAEFRDNHDEGCVLSHALAAKTLPT